MNIDQWIRDHAYAPDDIVLGNAGLTDAQLPALHQLLELVRPGWRELFDGERASLKDVTVRVSTELLAELEDWSPVVQVKINRTPGMGMGYEMVARVPLSYHARINDEWLHLHPADIRIGFPGDAA